MTIHDQEGLTVIVEDDESVAIYAEGVLKLEMTLDEFRAIAQAFALSPYAR